MSVQESSATALVRFTGLGIVCFNKERQRGEIAGIRDNKHILTVKIQRPVYQDGAEKDLIVYKDIATYENLPKEDVRIEIKNVAVIHNLSKPDEAMGKSLVLCSPTA